MKLLVLSLSVALLLWQLWRSRLSWSWRWLWLPVVASLVLMAMPPSWPQRVPAVVLLTPGDAAIESAALQWAAQHEASLLRLPTQPSLAELTALQEYPDAALQLFGYGFSAPVWQQLPDRVVNWTAPALPDWQLGSDSQVMLGDALSIHLQAPLAAHVVQLRDARHELIVDAPVLSGSAELSWRPTAAGQFDWLLQVRDQNDTLLRELPLAFAVLPPPVKYVQGQFSAPSFEQRALREWLQQTGMQGEFLSQTGQHLQRRDAFKPEQSNAQETDAGQIAADSADRGRRAGSEPPPEASVLLLDVRSWQQSGAAQQTKWLQRVARGAVLVLLADGSEAELAVRQAIGKSLAATWRQLSESEQVFVVGDISLQRASWQLQQNDQWQALAIADGSATASHDAVLTRTWQQGRVIWVGVNDSHRLWQRAREQYAQWWQQTLALPNRSEPVWHYPDNMVQGLPTPLCFDNVAAPSASLTATPAPVTSLRLQTPAGELTSLPLQVSSWPGQRCALYTPAEAGWYRISAPVSAWWRVYEQAPMPEQQQRAAYEATRQHQQQLPATPATRPQPLTRWSFALLFLLSLAVIWWRERQLPLA